MENGVQLLIFSSSIFIFFTIPAQSVNSCEPVSCDSNHGPEIRFPFRLKSRPERCGYPGFDLECNSKNQTILNLPQSGEFIVVGIDYRAQALIIDDPGSCLPSRALNFSLSGSPYRASYWTNFIYLNCGGDWIDYAWSEDYVPLPCLSDRNNTVLASSPAAQVPLMCQRMDSVSVPPWWFFSTPGRWSMELRMAFELGWSEPECGKCESRAGICRFKGDSGLEIGCSKSAGLPRGAKYAIIIGVGIPGLLCMMGVVCYTCSRIKTNMHQRRPNFELPTTIVFDQPPVIRAIRGLDLPTIESYPKTVLGQSCRLPKPSDTTCSICLCEYQPKQTLRSIPECNHFFHAGCIDEWLKINGTCPICRNLPDCPSISTPCSSTSSSSSSSLSSSTTLDPELVLH